MHPYTVIVNDPTSDRQILSIPCAESETAILVQKNMESLFPSFSIKVKTQAAVLPIKPTPVSFNNLSELAELEEDLFHDVA